MVADFEQFWLGPLGVSVFGALFAGVDHIEAHHEYVRDCYQREAALYFMGRLDKAAMAGRLLAAGHRIGDGAAGGGRPAAGLPGAQRHRERARGRAA